MKNTKNKLLMLAAVITALASLTASANTITPTTIGFIPGTSITYGADLTSGELHPGDGFTIFDVGGFTGFGALPAFWVPSVTPGSPFSPPAPGGPDDPSLANVTFTYVGAHIETAIGATPFNPFTVTLTPLATALVTDDWVSKDHLLGTAGVIDGSLSSGKTDQILVPREERQTVPDGGTALMFLGMSLTGLACLRRKIAA